MSITTLGIAKSLTFTQLDGGTSPISSIQSYNFSGIKKELNKFLNGLARVHTHYQGTTTASITITSCDIAKTSALQEGYKFNNVVLTIESAVDSAGDADGADVTITLSSAVITEVGPIEANNESKAPAVQSVTFTLQRHPGASSDPTVTIA